MTVWLSALLASLAQPNAVYVFFLAGLFGLVFGMKSRRVVPAGILGVLLLAAAFAGFRALPLHHGGMALLLFGVALMVLEAVTASGGLLALGGAVALIFGSLLLFGDHPESGRVSPWLIAVMTGFSAAVFVGSLKDVVKVLRRRAVQDTASLVGQRGVSMTDIQPMGVAHVDGEDWSARCPEGSVKKGETVRVIGLVGLSLVVEGLSPAEKEKEGPA